MEYISGFVDAISVFDRKMNRAVIESGILAGRRCHP
jgi:hypothetical protein